MRQTALAKAAGQDFIVIATYNVPQHAEQVSLVKAQLATGIPVIVVATGTPYNIATFPAVPTFLATYSFRDVVMESAVKVITGALNSSGKLPVAIPSLTHPDQLLYPYGFGLRWR